MKQKQLIAAVVGVVVAVNLIAFLVVKKGKAPEPPRPAPTPSTTSADPSADELQGRARRAAGLAALESGDYDRALINFTEAKALLGADAKVDEMLKITQDLRTRAITKKASDPAPVEPAKVAVPAAVVAPPPRPAAPEPKSPAPHAPPRPTTVAKAERAVERAPDRPDRSTDKPEPRPTEAPAPASSGTGMLLVSTTPRGLVVRVDGTATDLTPMRAPVKVGLHKVALYDGDRKLYEATVDVTEGQAATVLKDLSVEFAQLTPSNSGSAAAPVEPPKPETKPDPEPRPAERPTVVAAVTPSDRPGGPPEDTQTGGLQLTAPGLYGEIWINGRSYGFAPVTVEGLKPGSVKVDVRVNGAIKRSTVAQVEAGQVKAIKVR